MKLNSPLLVLTMAISACATATHMPQRQDVLPKVPVDTTLFVLDGEKILRAHVMLIDRAHVASVSHWVGRAALRFGPDTKEVVEIITKGGRSSGVARSDLLVLLDGREVTPRLMSVLDPTRIQRIDVLKGPQAAAYGYKARDGIILIATKSARLRL